MALFLKIANLYVSGTRRRNGKIAPENIKDTHIVHFHPLCSAAKPPTIGPMTGPKNGATQNKAIAIDMSMGELPQISEMVPPARDIGGDAIKPAKNLNTRMVLIFLDKPTPMVKSIDAGNVRM